MLFAVLCSSSWKCVFLQLGLGWRHGCPFSGSVGETHADRGHSSLGRSGAFALKFRSGQFFGSKVLALAAWMSSPEILGIVGT